MENINYSEKDLELENIEDEKLLLQGNNDDDDNNDDDNGLSYEELKELEDTMFPYGVDDDNYPDLSDSD